MGVITDMLREHNYTEWNEQLQFGSIIGAAYGAWYSACLCDSWFATRLADDPSSAGASRSILQSDDGADRGDGGCRPPAEACSGDWLQSWLSDCQILYTFLPCRERTRMDEQVGLCSVCIADC